VADFEAKIKSTVTVIRNSWMWRDVLPQVIDVGM